MTDPVLVLAIAALIIAMGVFVVALAIAGWWFARSLTALAAGALNLRQVRAVDDAGAGEAEPVVVAPIAETPPVESGKLNTRSRLSQMDDADLAAAIQDVKVITFDDNNGIEGDVAPIPGGGRGVYA